MPNLSFDEAVQHVTQHQGAAYAFVPDGKPVIGGQLYVLAYNDLQADDPDEWPYMLWYSAGDFGSSLGLEESYGPDDIPEEARSLNFELAALSFELTHMDYELQITLKLLQGASLAEARDDSDELLAGYGER